MSPQRVVTTTLPVRVHGSYLVAAPAAGAPRAAVVGFHGYGEGAAEHLAALSRIPGAERWLLCAIQALHPFYTRSGRVVASWMTSFDREHAIADNTAYAAAVVAELRVRHPGLDRLAYAGFSQGVAMCYRAAAASEWPADAVVVLAGDVPPDVAERESLALPPVLLGRGTTDTWYDAAKLERDLETLRSKGVPAEPVVFDGGHEWGEPFLARAGAFLRDRLGG